MEDKKEYAEGVEKRENVRWTQLIPSRLRLIDQQREIGLGDWRSGSIYNISAGGVCFEVSVLEEGWKEEMVSGRIRILLEIKFSTTKEVILALAKVVWLSRLWKEKEEGIGKYIIGLDFMDITTSSRDAIIDYILKSYAESLEGDKQENSRFTKEV